MEQAGLRAQIDLLLSDLMDAQAKMRILKAWHGRQITLDEAIELLWECGLSDRAELGAMIDE